MCRAQPSLIPRREVPLLPVEERSPSASSPWTRGVLRKQTLKRPKLHRGGGGAVGLELWNLQNRGIPHVLYTCCLQRASLEPTRWYYTRVTRATYTCIETAPPASQDEGEEKEGAEKDEKEEASGRSIGIMISIMTIDY